MKQALPLCCALFVALCATVASAETSSSALPLRVSVGGYGMFGEELTLLGLSEEGDRYGSAAEIQLNLLPEEHFNLWLSLGATYAPEQEFCDYQITVLNGSSTLTTSGSVDIESYGARLMLIPEWKPIESLGLGLRLGMQLSHYSGTLKGTTSLTRNGSLVGSGASNDRASETLLEGIVGLQVAWSLTENLGLTLYGDLRFGEDAELFAGETQVGTFETATGEVGLALIYVF